MLPAIDLLFAAALLAAVGVALVIFEISDRRARRRSARAWRSYFHEGGLVRNLIARWKGTPRLTDRRDAE